MRKLLLLAAVLVAACGGDSNGPARPNLDGTWNGTVQGSGGGQGQLSLVLAETNGSVTGTGNLNASGGALALTVNGTYAPPTASLTLSAQGFEDLNLQGTVDEQKITGTLNGSGFQNNAITLNRQ